MTDNEKVQTEDEPRDRARRRLIKLGIYLVPAVTSMTAYLRRANAQPAAQPQGQGAQSQADSIATVNPQ